MGEASYQLFVRADCELCEALHAALASHEEVLARGLTLVDIDSEARLQTLYHYRIPVLVLGEREIWSGPYDPHGLAIALASQLT